ncbi:MAG: hypothetical protein FWG56_09930 [Desulfovibrionaceae bacterium]|nr:hypothetical protein [Desulfovibrionaceae bacterium]
MLEQAWHLWSLDRTRPRQVNLRQAISCAYYALFHAIVQEGAALLAPANPAGLRANLARRFGHRPMREVCRQIARGAAIPGVPNVRLVVTTPSAELRRIADAFHPLQELRHTADYDLHATFDRLRAELSITLAENAIKDWYRILSTNKDEAAAFAVSLLFGGKEH